MGLNDKINKVVRYISTCILNPIFFSSNKSCNNFDHLKAPYCFLRFLHLLIVHISKKKKYWAFAENYLKFIFFIPKMCIENKINDAFLWQKDFFSILWSNLFITWIVMPNERCSEAKAKETRIALFGSYLTKSNCLWLIKLPIL